MYGRGAYVDDELTNHYIRRQLDVIDLKEDPEEARDLYLNHYYSVMSEYVAEYDPHQFTIVDGEKGLLRITVEHFVMERNGVWQIYDNQYHGCTPVSRNANRYAEQF